MNRYKWPVFCISDWMAEGPILHNTKSLATCDLFHMKKQSLFYENQCKTWNSFFPSLFFYILLFQNLFPGWIRYQQHISKSFLNSVWNSAPDRPTCISRKIKDHPENEHKLKVSEFAEMVNESTGSASTILHKKLGIKKVFSKWVPHLLTMEEKQHRIDDSESCLALFTRNKQDFLCWFVTMDKTWIHHFTLQSNQQQAGWHAADESCLKLVVLQYQYQYYRYSINIENIDTENENRNNIDILGNFFCFKKPSKKPNKIYLLCLVAINDWLLQNWAWIKFRHCTITTDKMTLLN